MIKVNHVTKYYIKAKPVISDLSLSFGDVGLNMIIGKSGCGKTTLLNMIGTMDQDYVGSIEFNETELSTLSYDKIADFRNYDSAYIFQLNSLFEDLTVNQNIEMVLNLQGNTTDVDEVLERVGLAGFGNRKVKYLSGGERQRVGIARAIAKDCKVILADEPTSALDTSNSHRIFKLLKEISKDRLVILVTHDVKKARQYADRVIRLVDGRVAEDEVLNEVNGTTKATKRNISSSKTLRPIFWSQIRRTFIINIFIAIIMALGIILVNIANEDGKILKEYDIIEEGQIFNDKRVLLTHELNGLDFYNVVPRGEEEDQYTYFKELKSANGGLNGNDIDTLKRYLKDYNIHTNNDKGNIIIRDVSTINRFSQEEDSIMYYWEEPQKSNYQYYLYNSNNNYDIMYGRTPISDNEIMITDIIAKEYLKRKDLDASDLSVVLNKDLKVLDIYHKVPSLFMTNRDYNYTEELSFNVVGIIRTDQFNYFDYNNNSYRYVLNKAFKQQSQEEDPYLNSITTYPHAYIVTRKDLNTYLTKTHFYDSYKVKGINYKGIPISNTTVNSFSGTHDYRFNKTVEDNLSLDRWNRLIITDTVESELQDNQIIITDGFLRLINPGIRLGTNSELTSFYYENIYGTQIEITFIGEFTHVTKTFDIVGLGKGSNNHPSNQGYFYFSDKVVHDFKIMDEGYLSALTVELDGVSSIKRSKIVKDLFEMGYLLSPVNKMPGAYLENIPGQGELELKGSDGYGDLVNLSVFHLFSPYYNNVEMDGLNSILEIISSIHIFVLIMVTIITAGFIFLKERRQKMDIMKLTQIGVREKRITRMNIINYIYTVTLMAVIAIIGTVILVNIINDTFIVELVGNDGVGLISRIRIIFTASSIVIPIIISIITFILAILATTFSTKNSKR